MKLLFALLIALSLSPAALAQTPPNASEIKAYTGLHAAAAAGDLAKIESLAKSGANLEERDIHRRTPLIVAVFMHKHEAARALMKLGADANALDYRKFDIVTIASVDNAVPMLKIAIEGGCKATNITSPYDGTALIAAAHLGHAEVVRTLIAAKAPLDHVNNLRWTALIESIVLGNGGKNHTDTLEALVKAGATVNLADGNGATPLTLAKGRGYKEMVAILEKAGAK
jgi:ankyrin repeat protein